MFTRHVNRIDALRRAFGNRVMTRQMNQGLGHLGVLDDEHHAQAVENLANVEPIETRVVNNRDRINTVTIPLRVLINLATVDNAVNMIWGFYNLLGGMLDPVSADNNRGITLRMRGAQGERVIHWHFGGNIMEFLDKVRLLAERYNEDETYELVSLTIASLSVPPMFTRGSTSAPKSMQQADSKWLVIDTPTNMNCFWVALATCKNWNRANSNLLFDASARQRAGQDLKAHAGCSDTQGSDVKEYQKAANYCKVKIQIVNHLFQDQSDGLFIPENCPPRNKEPYRIMIYKNHAKALLPRKEVMAKYPDREFVDPSNVVVEEIGIITRPQKRKRVSFAGQTTLAKLANDQYIIGLERFDTIEEVQAHLEENNLKLKELAPPTVPQLVDMTDLQEREEFDNPRKAALDLETCGQESNRNAVHRNYATGFAYYHGGENHYIGFWGYKTSIVQYFNWLYEKREMFKEYTVVCHNGSRFDFIELLNNYLYYFDNLWKVVNQLETDGKIISFEIRSVEKDKREATSIKFHDTALICPQSLDVLTKMLDVKHKKLAETVKHHKILDTNWFTFQHEVAKYLEHDCLGLLEVYQALGKALYEDSEMDITKYVTGASIAINTMYKKFYDKDRFPMFTLPPDMDAYIRDTGYLGGRTEAFYIGKARIDPTKGEMGNYYDVNSMYPWAGTQDLPYGCPESISKHDMYAKYVQDGILQDNFFGFVHVLITSTNLDSDFAADSDSEDPVVRSKRFVQLHGVKVRTTSGVERLVFPKFIKCNQPICLTSEEIKYSQKHKCPYTYEFVSGLKFQRGKCRYDFFNTLYEQRKLVKSTNPPLAEMLKLKLNSEYGRESMNPNDKNAIKIYPLGKADYYADYHNGKVVNIADKGKYTLVRKISTIPANKINIAVGAYITAYSRMKIHETIMQVIQAGGQVLYTDTDSVIAIVKAEGSPLWYQWNGTDTQSKNLGSMKNEFDEKFEKTVKVAKSTDDEIREAKAKVEAEGKGFDEIIIAGAKMYFLQRKLSDKINVTAHAFKGLSRRAYTLQIEDFEKLRRGEEFFPFQVLDEDQSDKPHVMKEERYTDSLGVERVRRVARKPVGQLSFVSGKKAIMTNTYSEAGVQVLYVTKKFKLNYTKGTYDKIDGYVNALKIVYGEVERRGDKRVRQDFTE